MGYELMCVQPHRGTDMANRIYAHRGRGRSSETSRLGGTISYRMILLPRPPWDASAFRLERMLGFPDAVPLCGEKLETDMSKGENMRCCTYES